MIEAHPESSQPDAAENYAMDTFSPCWMLNRAYQGKGYAYEAAQAFFGYLFREFVSFVNDADGNPIYENTIQYAILKREWMSR